MRLVRRHAERGDGLDALRRDRVALDVDECEGGVGGERGAERDREVVVEQRVDRLEGAEHLVGAEGGDDGQPLGVRRHAPQREARQHVRQLEAVGGGRILAVLE